MNPPDAPPSDDLAANEITLLWSSQEAESTTTRLVELYLDPGQLPQNEAWFEPFLKVLHKWHPAVCALILQHQLGAPLSLPDSALWSWDITLTDNATIAELNRDHRAKDQPTDVLSFPAWDEATTPPAGLPEITLGSIIISVEYAQTAGLLSASYVTNGVAAVELTAYLIERMTHGTLHLLGWHHDTMADYDRIVAWQHDILTQVCGPQASVSAPATEDAP